MSDAHDLVGMTVAVELLGFGRTGSAVVEDLTLADRLRHFVEVARADLALVARRGVAERFGRELVLLELGVGASCRAP